MTSRNAPIRVLTFVGTRTQFATYLADLCEESPTTRPAVVAPR